MAGNNSHKHDFDHIPKEHRAKVAKDFLAHLMPEGPNSWDMRPGKFNPLNDYQRHLFALFLRIAGWNEAQVYARIYQLSTDVPRNKKESYVKDVIHSAIVGFPRKDGSLIPIPSQEVVEA